MRRAELGMTTTCLLVFGFVSEANGCTIAVPYVEPVKDAQDGDISSEGPPAQLVIGCDRCVHFS